jgi:hypothetical protein
LPRDHSKHLFFLIQKAVFLLIHVNKRTRLREDNLYEVSAETTDVKLASGVSSGLERIPAFLTNEREDYVQEVLKSAIHPPKMSQSGKRDTTFQLKSPVLPLKQLFTSNREFIGRWKNESD